MSYNFLYDPQPLSISTNLHQHIAFRYSFTISIVNMKNTTCFDTPSPLYTTSVQLSSQWYAFYVIYLLIRLPHPSSISTNLHQPIALRYSFTIYIVNMRHTTCFDTPQPLIYQLCTAFNPIVVILYYITSYTTPSASFNFNQTSSTYCF